MSCRYYAYQIHSEKFMRGQKLLNENTIKLINAKLVSSNCKGQPIETHASLQAYDINGNTVSSPLYADFDGVGCERDVINLAEIIETEFGLLPEIYFSGNRGFHIMIPLTVGHTHPHRISKMFFETMSKSEFLDKQVYAARHLLRCDGSYHAKSGLYKTKITLDELRLGMDYIRSVSNKSQPERIASQKKDTSSLIRFLHTIIHRVNAEIREEREKNEYRNTNDNTESSFVPNCIREIITNEPLNGEWNETITTLARWFNNKGYQKEDAIAIMFNQDHFNDDQVHVNRVFSSVYRRPSFFGCENNHILQAYCCETCPFNEEELEL